MPRADRDLILSRRDLDFLLHEWLRVEDLTKRDRFAEHSRETIDAVLELAADLADREVRHAQQAQRRRGARVRRRPGSTASGGGTRPRRAAEAGLLCGTLDSEVGGLQLPHVVDTAVQAWFHAANVGTWAYAMLTVANVHLLLAHGTPEQIETWVPAMLEGRFHGTMCLSEPQAGSSLADITTRAEPRSDGSYRLSGTKMWISGGEHELGENIVHLVLAKIPGGAGRGQGDLAVPGAEVPGVRGSATTSRWPG